MNSIVCLLNVAGMGDMAVSNSIGSNIFDVLLGLGFPWALRTLIVSYGSVVTQAVLSASYHLHPDSGDMHNSSCV